MASETTPNLSISFDNLGEAAELALGVWPPDQPQGAHFSVVEALPRVLELLARLDLVATFFVEGLNAEVYPDALRGITAAGHEVAAHAWCHEQWAALGAEDEAELLRRTTAAMSAIGIRPRGFRPPGGGVTARTPALLREHGYSYHSPAGTRAGVADRLAVLPFRWPLVDAYFYLPNFGGLRERHGDGAEPMTPGDMRAAMLAALDRPEDWEGQLVLLFHPFIAAATGEEGFGAMADVLSHARELRDAGRCRMTRMDEAAAELLAAGGDAPAPALESASWMGAG
jgi:peptidoglycan/xylan/chitin deacetylase (PgdA/CDA1 family)